MQKKQVLDTITSDLAKKKIISLSHMPTRMHTHHSEHAYINSNRLRLFNQLSIWSDLLAVRSSEKFTHHFTQASNVSMKKLLIHTRLSLTVLVRVVMWGEHIINPLHHLHIQLHMRMFSALSNEATKIFNTVTLKHFTSYLCSARNFKPPSVHHVFRTMKQISTCASKFSIWYWAAESKPESSW
jgi:hypothetical protein